MEIKRAIVSGYGYDGEGVCRTGGKVVFIPFVLKGEEVEFSLDKETSSFCRGRLVNVLSPSPLRITPKCPYFGMCGGCAYQHMKYENELLIKGELLSAQLKKAGYEGEIEVCEGDRFYYRNKIKLFVQEGEIGLKSPKSNLVIDIQKCLLVSENINKTIDFVRKFVAKYDLYECFSEIVIREENNNVLINFYRKNQKKCDYSPLFNQLNGNYGIFESVKGRTRHIYGIKNLRTIEWGLKCEFSPTTFHQVNKVIMNKLYAKVLEYISGGRTLNLYSGGGVLSGILLKKCLSVVGVELGESEHKNAQTFKLVNNLQGLENIHGDCAKVLKEMREGFDCIVVDPPKAGMDKSVCDEINNNGAERIIYVSCDSGTLSRDITRLTNYKVVKAHLFDMFACTGEYETLVLLQKC